MFSPRLPFLTGVSAGLWFAVAMVALSMLLGGCSAAGPLATIDALSESECGGAALQTFESDAVQPGECDRFLFERGADTEKRWLSRLGTCERLTCIELAPGEVGIELASATGYVAPGDGEIVSTVGPCGRCP